MRRVLATPVAGVLALTLAACGGGNSGPSSGSGGTFADGKTFTMVLSGDPGNLDPHFTSLSVTHQVDLFLYDSLVNTDATNKEAAGLASQWSGDSTTAKFTLRKNITCSDGSPLTAADVANNINFVGDPANKSSRIGVFVPPMAKAVADEAAGTVTVTSATPDAFLVRNVGGLPIVCAKGMRDRKLLAAGADGTGPYTMTEAVANDHYTLTLRKGYGWGPGDWTADPKGIPATVVLKVVPNETTAANLLLSGGVNAVQLGGPDRQRVQAQKGHERDVLANYGELWFNQKAGLPTADEPVRRALVQALDLAELRKVLTSGTGKPATGLVAAGMGPCGEDSITGNLPATDTAAAKTALTGKSASIILLYPTSYGATMQSTAELIQRAWTAAGAQVTIRGVTEAEVTQQVVAGQGSWTAALLPLNLNLPTQAVSFVSGPTAPDGTNFANIQNPAYTAAVQRASAKPGTAGCPDWAAAEKALYQRVDLVPFAVASRPNFGKGVTFELTSGDLAPTSVRMLG